MEFLIEAPKTMIDEVKDVITKCMIAGGKPFCPNVFLGADPEVSPWWVH